MVAPAYGVINVIPAAPEVVIMSRSILIVPGMLGLVLVLAPAAWAVSPGELKQQCREWLDSATTPAAVACESYLTGFLNGLRVDAQLRVSAEPEVEESWIDRGARTRVSRTRWARVRASQICMPQPMPMREIVSHVVEYLDVAVELSDAATADAVASTLRRHYSCD
jgi:hypothetical protein